MRIRSQMTVLVSAAALLLVVVVDVQRARACDPGPDYGPDEVVVEKSGKRSRVKLNYRRHEYTFAGGHRTLSEVQVFTKNKRLIKFLKGKGMGSKMWKAVQKTANRATCATLLNGKALARLERSLKATVARHYRAKTRRSPGALDIMLVTDRDQSGNTACVPPKRKR